MYLKRIKDLREDNDLSQTTLANALNITQRAYSHYETGTRELPLEILIKLADFYKTSTDYLLERTNKK
ncbi:MAG: helix-turn-helix transcriptional regulator [Coprobacillus sp.]